MNHNAQRMTGKRSWGHPVLGLFAAVWLNLALQPCAMALEADHDCPHCPPAQEQAMASHHDHGEMQKQAPCASLDAPCGALDDVNLDGRSGQFKVKDVAELPIAITGEVDLPTVVVARTTVYPTGPPQHAGNSPPRHVLFCVYLK